MRTGSSIEKERMVVNFSYLLLHTDLREQLCYYRSWFWSTRLSWMVLGPSWCFLGLQPFKGYIELQWFKMALTWTAVDVGCQLGFWSFWPEHIYTAPPCGLGFSLQSIWVLTNVLKERNLKLSDFHNAWLHSEVFEWYFFVLYCSKTVTGPAWIQIEDHKLYLLLGGGACMQKKNIIICNHFFCPF